MSPDLGPEHGHLDAAGLALGALDPADALAFQDHLPGCAQCQQAVADFQRVATALRRPSPPIELPPDLEERTITRVLQAAAAASQPSQPASQPGGQEARVIRFPLRTRRTRLLTAVAAAAAVAAAVVVPLSLRGAGASTPVAAEFSLQAITASNPAWGNATVYHESASFKIVLHLHQLAATHPGQSYGLSYIGPQSRQGKPTVITVGSFTVGSSGLANPTMWSAANPAKYRTMEITIDTGSGTAPGKEILVGHAAL